MMLWIALTIVVVIAVPVCIAQYMAMRDHLRSLPPVRRNPDEWRWYR